MNISNPPSRVIQAGAPLLFVFLWSTGFIGAKYGLPNAEPFTFLAIRMAITSVSFLFLIWFIKSTWPSRPTDYFHISLTGLLIHCVYLGGVFYAIHLGLAVSISALIIGLQPILTVMIASGWLGETLSARKIIGMCLGFVGVSLVLGHEGINTAGVNFQTILFCIISLVAISVGTTYQKRFCSSFELLPMVFIQFLVNAVVLALLSLGFEERSVNWNQEFILALLWLVLVLSVGTSLLLLWLIKQGEAGKVGSLFYLVPPFVTVEAWILFDEKFGFVALSGMAACAIGVALVIISPKSGKSSTPN